MDSIYPIKIPQGGKWCIICHVMYSTEYSSYLGFPLSMRLLSNMRDCQMFSQPLYLALCLACAAPLFYLSRRKKHIHKNPWHSSDTFHPFFSFESPTLSYHSELELAVNQSHVSAPLKKKCSVISPCFCVVVIITRLVLIRDLLKCPSPRVV